MKLEATTALILSVLLMGSVPNVATGDTPLVDSVSGVDGAAARGRDGPFEPQIVPKHQTRWTGFDERILSLYVRDTFVSESPGCVHPVARATGSSRADGARSDAARRRCVRGCRRWQAGAIRGTRANSGVRHRATRSR